MSCRAIEGSAFALLDGSLPAEEATGCRRHLRACRDCRRLIDQARHLQAHLARLGEKSGAGVDDRSETVLRTSFRWWSQDPHDPLAGLARRDAEEATALLASDPQDTGRRPSRPVGPGLVEALCRKALFDSRGPSLEAARRCAAHARTLLELRAAGGASAEAEERDLAGVPEAVGAFLDLADGKRSRADAGFARAAERAAERGRDGAGARLEHALLRALARPEAKRPPRAPASADDAAADAVERFRRAARSPTAALAGRLLHFLRCLASSAYEGLRFSDPSAYSAACGGLAPWAAALLPLIDGRGEARLAAVDCRAWVEIHRGNALSILARAGEAGAAFAAAAELAAAGSGNPRLEIHLRCHRARARSRRGRHAEALAEFERALGLARAIGDLHRQGCILSDQSITLAEMGRLEQSDEVLGRALELLDAERSPSRVLFAKHNLVVNLHERGSQEAAVELLREIYPLYAEHARGSNVARLRWVEAAIVEHQGDHATALRLYRKVRDGFSEMSLPREVALVSLELMGSALALGRLTEVAEVAADTLEICRTLEIEREAIAAMILLRRSARTEQLTTTLLQRLGERVRRSVEPGLT